MAEVEGEIENIERKPILTNVRLSYRLRVPKGKRAEAERALELHEQACPVAISLKRGIAISWKANIEED